MANNILSVSQNGVWVEVPALKGEKGDTGDSYTITESDYEEIANIVIAKIGNAEGEAY